MPVLDRRIQFDERSRAYPIRALLPPKPLRGWTWRGGPVLDQGEEGACVGFAWAGEAGASPVRVPGITDAVALAIYQQARTLDEWPGEDYDGTSVLGGAKAMQARHWLREYRWGFSIDDVLDALAWHGPIVVGTNWRDAMYDPRPSGLVDVSGPVVGGHAWLLRGLSLHPRLPGETLTEPVVRARNSWGPSYGAGGDLFIRVADLAGLLDDQGEACVPVLR